MKLEDFVIHDYVTADLFQGTESFKEILIQGNPVVVKENTNFKGVLTLNDLLVNPYNLIIDSYSPKPLVNSDDDALPVLALMCQNNYEFLPILKNGNFDGVISKKELFLKFLDNEFKEDPVIENQDVVELTNELVQKNKFLAIIGHDIKNMFNQVLGSLELLDKRLQNISDVKVQKTLQMARQSALQVNAAFEDMLLWARLSTGQLQFAPRVLLLNKYITDAVIQFQLAGNVKNLTINNSLESELEIFADENMLKCILLNLVYNAIKFTPSGGMISVHAQSIENNTVLVVEDSGQGMSSQIQNRIFNENYSTVGTSNEAGLGMGLIICKEFIEKHKGEIHISSEVGIGTRVIVSFPNHQAI